MALTVAVSWMCSMSPTVVTLHVASQASTGATSQSNESGGRNAFRPDALLPLLLLLWPLLQSMGIHVRGDKHGWVLTSWISTLAQEETRKVNTKHTLARLCKYLS